ncbi:hypothetical protein BGZ79_008382 [Entomortierella chlamydospora]|nr:hypothetical protein BGZ79_008382 [Entomortierella chlamydospora]
MSQDTPEANPRPNILIIGAGIAGLTLAILLEQINIPYHIFERAAEVKPLDILVGADGGYSGVRQSMYKLMDEKGVLPKEDLEDFTINYTTIVGVATPSNPEKYPKLKDEYSSFSQVIYGDGSNCYVITLPDNQISWGFGVQLSKSALKEMHFRNSEWDPEVKDTTLEQYRDFPCPVGGTMGELFDATPKHLISKVFLEEKMFKTCHNSRSVLIGDAWHKFHPAGGAGAQHAIQDAVSLANCLYSMKDSSLKSINSAFGEYYKQRYNRNDAKFKHSADIAKILNGQVKMEKGIGGGVIAVVSKVAQELD